MITQTFAKHSQNNVSEFSDNRITDGLSRHKLKEESSLNKSSREPMNALDDVASEENSLSSTETRSEVFVRTKAANVSSIEDPLDMNLETVDK